ncbi:hypothetical protein [Coleofasciculus sp. E2-BRE-01]
MYSLPIGTATMALLDWVQYRLGQGVGCRVWGVGCGVSGVGCRV